MSDPLSLPSPEQPARSRKHLVFVGLAALILLSALAWWRYAQMTIVSESAVVDGSLITYIAQVSGTVLSTPVKEGEDARQGSLVLAMDEIPLREALAEAETGLHIARQGGVPSPRASASVREAEQDALRAADERRLEEQKAQRALEHWSAEHARAIIALRAPAETAQRNQAVQERLAGEETQTRARMNAARRDLDERTTQRIAADAAIKTIRAANAQARPGPEMVAVWEHHVAEAKQNLANAAIIAPADARLVKLAVQEGQRVTKGDELLMLAPLGYAPSDGLWVHAVFSAADFPRLREGQSCRVALENGPTLTGVIGALGDGTSDTARYARVQLELPPPGTPVHAVQNARVSVRVTE